MIYHPIFPTLCEDDTASTKEDIFNIDLEDCHYLISFIADNKNVDCHFPPLPPAQSRRKESDQYII